MFLVSKNATLANVRGNFRKLLITIVWFSKYSVWVSPFCFVIGAEFSVIFGGGKLTINEIKRNCIVNTLEIFSLHILYFPSERKTKSTPIEKKQWTPSSSWQQEPRSITNLLEAQRSLVPEYRNHWHQIRTHFSCKNRILDWYNFRQPQELITHLNNIFTDQSTVFKLNVSWFHSTQQRDWSTSILLCLQK